MDKIRGKITEWREHKSTVGEAGMRDFEARSGENLLTIKEQVEIEGTWRVALRPSGTTLDGLDLE
jgi:hypothetical protein